MDEFIRRADAELESSEREVNDVRAILADAAERLLHGLSQGDTMTAVQFQDISDQLLATVLRRISAVRAHMRAAAEDATLPAMPNVSRPVQRADLQPGSVELF